MLETHAFVLVTTWTKFRHCILGKCVIIKVSLPTIKHVFYRAYLHGKIANILAQIKEYDS